jgi:hypothetical protein
LPTIPSELAPADSATSKQCSTSARPIAFAAKTRVQQTDRPAPNRRLARGNCGEADDRPSDFRHEYSSSFDLLKGQLDCTRVRQQGIAIAFIFE